MRLNLGCGYNRRPGYVNVDHDPKCEPDKVCDLESFPWPFESNSVTEVVMSHILEHLGQTTSSYLNIIKELYRICKAEAVIVIDVPHPRHDSYLCDPTHVRPIIPESFQLFSKAKNEEWIQKRKSNTTLALQLNVDFEITRINYQLEDRWSQKMATGELTGGQMQEVIDTQFNVVKQTTIELKVIKAEAAKHIDRIAS